VNVRYLPFQLNPDMPQGGHARAITASRNSARSSGAAQLDARVAAEGRGEGIEFVFERMGAHRPTPSLRTA